jgi:hypothetical protein
LLYVGAATRDCDLLHLSQVLVFTVRIGMDWGGGSIMALGLIALFCPLINEG